MNKNNPISLTTSRIAEIFHSVLDYRRILYLDNQFFKMADLLLLLSGDDGPIQFETFRSREGLDAARKAFVIEQFGLIRIRVEESFMALACKGEGFSNFTLAHEFGHSILRHPGKVNNLQLTRGNRGNENRPQTVEELEAHYAAVFLQCGVAIFDVRLSAQELSRRAYSDLDYVAKLQPMVQLPLFLREFNKPKPRVPRVIF